MRSEVLQKIQEGWMAEVKVDGKQNKEKEWKEGTKRRFSNMNGKNH